MKKHDFDVSVHHLATKQLSVFFFLNVLVQWKRCNLAIALLSEHTYHKACHTSARIPLTSLVPADFLLWCSQRAAETHRYTHSHTHTHTPLLVHTQIYEQTYIHTSFRRRHHAAFGLNHRTLDISICVTMFVHILHKNRTACLQMYPCCCGLVCNLTTHIISRATL